MADADALEAALSARWDRDTLAVYADCLQARGDPRGELIALDLEIAERGATPELATRRRRRLYEWLGGSTICDRPWHEGSFRFGFATDFYVTHDTRADAETYLRALDASPAGPFVRGLTIYTGDPRQLQAALAVLVRTPRRWLERLDVRVVEAARPLSDRLVGAVIAATPRLATLAVHGGRALASFPHPSVTTVVVDGSQVALLDSIPNVTAIDLALEGDDEPPEHVIAAHVGGRPALRTVDLARNEPGYPAQHPPSTGVVPFAATLPITRLARLRLPSLRTPEQAALVVAMLDGAATLEIVIAQNYEMHAAAFAGLAHPRLRLPAPRPWPSRDTMSSREALTITTPLEEYGDDVSLTQLIDRLEDQLDELPAAPRARWLEWWRFLAGLGWDDADGEPITLPYPAAPLLEACEALDDHDAYTGLPGHWAQLTEKLRAAELPAGAELQIRRYWGW